MSESTDQPNYTDYAIDSKTYIELEQNFQAVIQELIGDKTLDSFRENYQKLHSALKRANENNHRLIAKCKELNDEITLNSAKVERSLELLQQDRRTITALRQEIDKAWKMVETAQGREKKSSETIDALKAEIAHLTQLVEQGGLLSYGHDNDVKALIQKKTDLINERDHQIKYIKQLNTDISSLSVKTKDVEKQKKEMEATVHQLRNTLTQKNSQIDNETLHRDRLIKQLQNLRNIHQNLANQIESNRNDLNEIQAEEANLNQSIADAKQQIEKLQAENAELQRQEEDIEADIHKETEHNKELQSDIKSLDAKLEDREKNIRMLKNEIDRKSRENHTIQQNIMMTRHLLAQDQTELVTLQTEAASMEKEIADLNRELNENKDKHEALQTKLKNLEQTKAKTKAQIDHQHEQTKEEQKHKQELEDKLMNYHDQEQKMKQKIISLEKKRELCAREVADAQVQYIKAQEEAKMSEIQLNHTQRLISDADEELKEKQKSYEQLRVERNTFNQQLMDAQKESVKLHDDYKEKQKVAAKLKKKISKREDTYMSEKFEFNKAKSRQDKLKAELKRLRDTWASAEATMTRQQEELKTLETQIREADKARQDLLNDQINKMKDRDILGTQLIRRNDEIALLFEKINILQDALKKGEIEYNKRCEEANEIKRLIKDTQRKNLILQGQCDQAKALEKKVQQLKSDLIAEQTRVKALGEELEDPNNPHRWRHLYGEDPPPGELLNIIKQLQKRLLKKNENILNTKKEIAQIEAQIKQYQDGMNELPSPDLVRRMKELQLKVKQKDRQVKAMAAELNTQQSRLAEFQTTYQSLNKQLSEARSKQFSQKKIYNTLRSRSERNSYLDESSRSTSQQGTDGSLFDYK